jgi:transcriptional regulator with XRE-family HTH domain
LGRGVSIHQAAARSGLSQSSLSEWESGRHVPRPELLAFLLDGLRATPEERRRLYELLGQAGAWEALGLPPEARVGSFNADALLGLRLRARLTQQGLAGALGISQAAISRWERGDTEPRPEQLGRLAGALGLRPEELAALAGGARGRSVVTLLSERKDPGEYEEYFPPGHALDEGPGALELLAAYHVVQRRAALDPRWQELHLRCAESYADILMRTRRNQELLRFSSRTLGRLDRREVMKLSVQNLSIMRVLALHRIRDRLPVSDAARVAGWAEHFMPNTGAWALATAAGIAAEWGDRDAVVALIGRVADIQRGQPEAGGAVFAMTRWLTQVGEYRRALDVLEEFWHLHWQTTPPGDPGAISLYSVAARLFYHLGDRAQAERLLTQGESALGQAITPANREAAEAERRGFADVRRLLEGEPGPNGRSEAPEGRTPPPGTKAS